MKEEEKQKIDVKKVQNRELLYKLIISQLLYDDHQEISDTLMKEWDQDANPVAPSERLFQLVTLGLAHEHEMERPLNQLEYALGLGLDLEYETEPQSSAPEPAMYQTAYVTSHKDKCHSGAFSMDGNLVATGSVDASIKILDVDRMLAKSDPDAVEIHPDAVMGHPVIRTLYDHLGEITCLEFHPREQILVSGSRDTNIKLFDFSKTSAKKAFKTFTDSDPITCLSLHPTGDYLVAGTDGPAVRVIDLATCCCFVSPRLNEHHTNTITSVKYSSDGRLFASSSKDGDIKVWDGVSGRCVQTFSRCHDGHTVNSVCFSRNGKYLLSGAMDSVVRLWELSTGRCLIAYTGAGTLASQQNSTSAIFNHTEDFVMYPDEATTSLCSWESRNGQRKNLLSLGHNGPIRHMVHSPCSPAFVTCSDDFRARFWYRRNVH
uniref:Cleavage stimulation factor 50 kDa subunit n=1 Tax=Hirondellea gigas TaxID=1518452 RepID=A0A2P2I6D6_9CRUS